LGKSLREADAPSGGTTGTEGDVLKRHRDDAGGKGGIFFINNRVAQRKDTPRKEE